MRGEIFLSIFSVQLFCCRPSGVRLCQVGSGARKRVEGRRELRREPVAW